MDSIKGDNILINYTIGAGGPIEPIRMEISDDMKEALSKNEEAAIQELQSSLMISYDAAKLMLQGFRHKMVKATNVMFFGKEACENLTDRKKRTAKLLSAPAKRMRGASYKTYKRKK